MIKLTQWAGSFDAGEHRYFLDGKELKGVTGMLHRRIFKDTYKGVSQDVLRNAAERGHMIHSRVELYDSMGVGTDMPEVASYARLKAQNGFEWIASEYLVSNNESHASAIDKVFHKEGDADNEVWLIDIKTTYNFNREYVSWQLSVYAPWFEQMNPGLVVKGLAGMWLREDKTRGTIAKVIPVERKPVELVRELIRCDHEDRDFNVPMLPQYITDTMDKLVFLTEQIKALTAEKEELTQSILDEMKKNDVKSVDAGVVLYTVRAAGTKQAFDSKRFKEENEELYNKYLRESTVKESLSVTIRN